MNILLKSEKVTDEMIDSAMHDEIRKTLAEDVLTGEKAREIEAAAVTRALKDDKEHPILGRRVAVIPLRDYLRMRMKYGSDEVASDEFVRFFQRKYPHLAPQKL